MYKQGILVGRPGSQTQLFSWSIIPDTDELDVVEADLPVPYDEMFIVNMRRAAPLLRNLYLVRFLVEEVPSIRGGFLPIARDISIVKRYPLSEFRERVVEVDGSAKTIEFPVDRVDEAFIYDLHRLSGTGVKLIKRFYSTPVLFKVESKDGNIIHVMESLKASFLFLQENPGLIEAVTLLPKYKIAVILTADPVPYEEFAEGVVRNAVASAKAFDNIVRNLKVSGLQASMAEED